MTRPKQSPRRCGRQARHPDSLVTASTPVRLRQRIHDDFSRVNAAYEVAPPPPPPPPSAIYMCMRALRHHLRHQHSPPPQELRSNEGLPPPPRRGAAASSHRSLRTLYLIPPRRQARCHHQRVRHAFQWGRPRRAGREASAALVHAGRRGGRDEDGREERRGRRRRRRRRAHRRRRERVRVRGHCTWFSLATQPEVKCEARS